MGKIHYRPNRNNKPTNPHITGLSYEEKKVIEEENAEEGTIKENIRQAHQLDHIKAIGDLGCSHHFYLEDYVYTYLYQYAQADLSRESAALFVGKFYEDSQEAVITGVIPVPTEGVTGENEWISEEVIDLLEKEKEEYFKGQDIIGWMHMQPGYGTMLTMKELREHRAVLGEKGHLFMLLDPINKVETLFAYENGELLEQSGYYMYYQRNEAMQRYMVEHPFLKKEVEIIEDSVVNQFREIGKMRKQEYVQRKNVNITVVAASILLIALTAVIVKMNDGRNDKAYAQAIAYPNISQEVGEGNGESVPLDDIKFTINSVYDKAVEELNQEGRIGEGEPALPSGIIQNDVVENEEVLNAEKLPEADAVEIKLADKQENQDKQVKEMDKQYDTYIIKEGDTLANITFNKYGSTSKAKEIAEINGLNDTNYIKVGQSLKLPSNQGDSN